MYSTTRPLMLLSARQGTYQTMAGSSSFGPDMVMPGVQVPAAISLTHAQAAITMSGTKSPRILVDMGELTRHGGPEGQNPVERCDQGHVV